MRIHLTGIGGVAMANLAFMLKEEKHTITGSDKGVYPPVSDKLKEWEIQPLPFDPQNLKKSDLCIIGNVISRRNREVEAILNQQIPYMSMPEALRKFFLETKKTIVIAGTHGKTTTSFLIDHIFSHSGNDTGFFAGGTRVDGKEGFRLGSSPYFVIEGDEYDTSFFDKRAKFLHYRPYCLILTSLEYDHADIYPDFPSYCRSFEQLLNQVPSEGCVIACKDDPHLQELLKQYTLAPVFWYGSDMKDGNSYFIRNRQGLSLNLQALPFREGKSNQMNISPFPLIGSHNASNATASTIAASFCGITDAQIETALASFPGVKKRQEIWLNQMTSSGSQIILMEDFAHHPSAVVSSLQAVRNDFVGFQIHLLFEPRSATSHRNIFQREYEEAFTKADHAYLTEVYDLQKVAPEERLNIPKMVQSLSCKKASKISSSFYAENPQRLLEVFQKQFKPSLKGDIVLSLSNGDFGGILPKLKEYLEEV